MRLIGEFRWGEFRMAPRARPPRRYARPREPVTHTAVPRTIVGGANPGRSAVAPPVRPGQTSSLCPANAAISATPLRRTHKAWVHHDVLGGRHNQRYVVVEHSGFASSLWHMHGWVRPTRSLRRTGTARGPRYGPHIHEHPRDLPLRCQATMSLPGLNTEGQALWRRR